VQFEAAKTICELFEALGGSFDVEGAFQVLTVIISNSAKPVSKYSSLRVMNKIASKQPALVSIC